MSTITASSTLTGTYTIDPTHSRIGFVARHAMVTKVRGSFNDFDGAGYFDAENPASLTAAADDPGRQHRHPQRRPRRAPALERLLRHGRPTPRSPSSSTAVEQSTTTTTG